MTGGRFQKPLASKLALCIGLALLLPAGACNKSAPVDTRAADEIAIRDLDAQWSKTAGAKDLEGTVSFYSDDASLLPANAPMVTGKGAIRAVWTSILSQSISTSWQASKADVARSGDLAYSIGAYTTTIKGPEGKPVQDHGKYVEVWRKRADGKWKVVADIFNSDLPPPHMPTDKK